jgi:hypothetical protein
MEVRAGLAIAAYPEENGAEVRVSRLGFPIQSEPPYVGSYVMER